MGYSITEQERESKRKAGRLGAAARKETIQKRLAAAHAEKDRTLDEQSLQEELHKLRQELGVISWTQLSERSAAGSTQYTDFIDLGEVALSGIVWNKQYCQPERFDEIDKEEEKPLIEQRWFRLSPDWCCQQMIRIGRSEYPLPEPLIAFEIKVFQAFLDWASKHLADKLDWVPQIVAEIENRKQGKEVFDQKLKDKIEREESHRPPEYKVPVVVPDKAPSKFQQLGFDDPIIPRTPFLDVHSTYDNNVSPQALDFLIHGRRG